MGAEARKAEDSALSIFDGEHHPRAKVGVGTAPGGAVSQPGGHDLVGRVTKLPEMVQERVRADRRVADGEGPEDLLLQTPLGERVARGLGGAGFPEMRLEELAGIRQQLLDPVLGNLRALDFLRRDSAMLARGQR